MKSQSGFTLIEMVAVIIILAIMAATAMPRFVNLSGEARLAALNGMVGAVDAARSLAKAKWVTANSADLVTIDMGGTNVSVVSSTTPSGTKAQGYPLQGNPAGMWFALDNPTGFSSGLVGVSGLVIWPTGVTRSSICSMWYSPGSGVTMVVSGNLPASCL